MRLLLLFALFACHLLQAQTTCSDHFSELVIEIKTDSYGYETAWEVKDKNGNLYAWVNFNTYGNKKIYRDTVCVPTDLCMNFNIYDGFGDGIGPIGYYQLQLNGNIIAHGGSFGKSEAVFFQCADGEICDTAIPVDTGQYIAPFDDTWYVFTPDSTGIYRISTCDSNTCDTKIWVYDHCNGLTVAEDNQSTILFNDDENPCAPLATVVGYLYKGKTYYIRIGDKEDACMDSIHWALSFEGPVRGCMDPQSCNYNPLATIDDGSCLPQGDSHCPKGPDLRIRQDSLIRSLRMDTVHVSDYCLIGEGCLRGYGVREVLRFTTLIENIGERDYYIGKPSPDNPQFTYNNCHHHYHYESYAKYTLYSEDGSEIPIGYKYGFCVTDFGCPPGIVPKFSCDNMGISAGCYDNYWSELQCQWIDLTDVPDGSYVFVVRINWKNLPDALGQVEKDMNNNWAQVCIRLDRSAGKLRIFVEDDCQPYTDCLGAPYGNAQPDCAGVCGGVTVTGDVDENGFQNINDAHTYVTRILGNDIQPSPCTDLDGDSTITVYDAALLANCINFGAAHEHTGVGADNHCQFPAGITNINDTVSLSILDVNWDQQYVDIGIRNPSATINAYQFEMSGLIVAYVDNLVNDDSYPIAPRTSMTDGMIIGISYQDSLIAKSEFPQPLCRVHFFKTYSDTICIQKIIDIVNGNCERVIATIEEGCYYSNVSGTPFVRQLHNIRIAPNPFRDQVTISFYNPDHHFFDIEITDLNGKVVQSRSDITGNEILIPREDLPDGVYFYRLVTDDGYATGKLIAQ